MAVEYKALQCERCGAGLRVHADASVVACTHCGVQHVPVRREGQVVSLQCLEALLVKGVNSAERASAAAERAADELALRRAQEELEALEVAGTMGRRVELLPPKKDSELWNLREGEANAHYAEVGWIALLGFLVCAGSFFWLLVASSNRSSWIGPGVGLLLGGVLIAGAYMGARTNTSDAKSQRERVLRARIAELRERLEGDA
jgi:DNA-directed RNA polymerase subunit RPC12/RpoP